MFINTWKFPNAPLEPIRNFPNTHTPPTLPIHSLVGPRVAAPTLLPSPSPRVFAPLQILSAVLTGFSTWPSLCFKSRTNTHTLTFPSQRALFSGPFAKSSQSGTLTLGYKLKSIQTHCSVIHMRSQSQKGGHIRACRITSIFAFSLFSLPIIVEYHSEAKYIIWGGSKIHNNFTSITSRILSVIETELH